MEIEFAIHYHPKVVREDIPALSLVWSKRIRAAIEEKLMYAPEKFGKPLRESLRGYRKLRVGEYRIVFRIEHYEVFVLAILHRSIVYKSVNARIV